MIIEGLTVAVLAKTFYDTDKAAKMDDRALEKYAKAFEKNKEAELLVHKKAAYADKRLANVAKKKRAIVQNTVPKFVSVYSQIQKIELENKVPVNEIISKDTTQKLEVYHTLSISVKREFTDKELVCGWLTKGIGGLLKMDSERYLSAAKNTMRAANVIYSQSESIASIYDAIVARADRISNLLMKMNALFLRAIQETSETIKRNGLNVREYSEYDKGVLMTCVNLAAAMSDLITIPVVDEEGHIYEAATEMLSTGEQYLEKMSRAINNV